MRKPIHEHSLKYVLLRTFVDFYFHIFFRKVTTIGKENIPKGEPVLFAVNHQCTLMDAFAVIFTLRSFQVFMARADIFKNPMAAKFLRFIKIIPIFRMRDGIKNLANNDSSFEDAIGTLIAKERLVILPEGSHFGEKRLRVLKKGLARIAFSAEERKDFKLGIKVIPVGLDYTDYIKFGSKVLVEYGKPFTLDEYFEEYKQQPQKAMNRFMGDLRKKMIPQMLHINDTENYDGIKACCDIYENSRIEKQSQYKKRLVSQKLSDSLLNLKNTDESAFESILNKSLQIKANLDKLNLRYWSLNTEKFNIIAMLISRLLQIFLAPIFVVGYLSNLIPFKIPVLLTKKVKDPMFFSSIRVAAGAIVFTLYYIIVSFILLLTINPTWLAAIIVATMVLSGLLSYPYYRWFVKTSAKFRNNRYVRRKNTLFAQTKKEYFYLMDKLSVLL